MDQNEINKRIIVLEAALSIEYFVSQFLGLLLDIDVSSSVTLSNKTSSLSLKNKIDLFMDMKAIVKEDVKKFELFMSIRNQFMHNIDCKDFKLCFQHLQGQDNYLLKLYPQLPNLTQEEKLEGAFKKLFLDLAVIIFNVGELYKDKLKIKLINDLYENSFNNLFNKLK